MKKEIWKKIPWNPAYLVSSFGRVQGINVTRNGKRRYGTPDKDGYLRLLIYSNGKSKLCGIHRLVAETFLRAVPGKPQVNHKDGNKQNNRVENLEWCSLTENRRHAFKTGLQKVARGESHGFCKLTDKQVLEIRRIYAPYKLTLSSISKKYGVCFQHISKIINLETRI